MCLSVCLSACLSLLLISFFLQGLISGNYSFDVNVYDENGVLLTESIRVTKNRSEIIIIYRTDGMLLANADVTDPNIASEDIDLHILLWTPSAQAWLPPCQDCKPSTSINRISQMATSYLDHFQSPVQIGLFFNYTDQYGIFGMRDTHICTNIQDTSEMSLEILRRRGAYGDIKLAWEIETEAGYDVLGRNTQESITVPQGQRRSSLLVPIPVPTANVGRIKVSLLSSEGLAEIEQPSTTIFVVKENVPGGIIEFSQKHSSSMKIQESSGGLELTVVRRCGLDDSATVQFTTMYKDSGDAAATPSLLETSEYVVQPSAVTFNPGQESAILNVNIKDDDIPEVDETLMLSFTPGDDYTKGPFSSLDIIIPSNDEANGVFTLSHTDVTVQEGVDDYAVVRVLRERGLYGAVEVAWTAVGTTASGIDSQSMSSAALEQLIQDAKAGNLQQNVDFIPESSTVFFAEGQASADLRVYINNDNVRELAETFTITLASASGGGVIRPPTAAEVKIEPKNDNSPVFVGDSRTVIFQEDQLQHADQEISSVAATDPDLGANGQVTYTVGTSQTTCDWLTVKEFTGTLTTTRSVMPWNTDGTCTLSIVASDQGMPKLSTSLELAVHINFSARCRPGSNSTLGSLPCELCPVSEYQNEYGQQQCIACPAGSVTEATGATSLSQCLRK